MIQEHIRSYVYKVGMTSREAHSSVGRCKAHAPEVVGSISRQLWEFFFHALDLFYFIHVIAGAIAFLKRSTYTPVEFIAVEWLSSTGGGT